MDLYTTFFARDPMNSETGLKYRRNFLQLGASRPEAETVQKFLGRKPSTVPYFEFLSNAPKPPPPANSPSSHEATLRSRLA